MTVTSSTQLSCDADSLGRLKARSMAPDESACAQAVPEPYFLMTRGARVHDAQRPPDKYACLWHAVLSVDQQAHLLQQFLAQFSARQLKHDLQLRAALALAAPFLGEQAQPLSVDAMEIALSYKLELQLADDAVATPYDDASCLAAGRQGGGWWPPPPPRSSTTE